jgi:deoxyinosine 3'endonuclease (endonuclease V)
MKRMTMPHELKRGGKRDNTDAGSGARKRSGKRHHLSIGVGGWLGVEITRVSIMAGKSTLYSVPKKKNGQKAKGIPLMMHAWVVGTYLWQAGCYCSALR